MELYVSRFSARKQVFALETSLWLGCWREGWREQHLWWPRTSNSPFDINSFSSASCPSLGTSSFVRSPLSPLSYNCTYSAIPNPDLTFYTDFPDLQKKMVKIFILKPLHIPSQPYPQLCRQFHSSNKLPLIPFSGSFNLNHFP